MAAVDISVFVGETHETFDFTWLVDNVALDLTGATVTAHFTSAINPSESFAGTGTLTVTSPTAGTLTYKFAATEVAYAGQWLMQFKAVFGDGTVEYSRWVTVEVDVNV